MQTIMKNRFSLSILLGLALTASIIVGCVNLDGTPDPNLVTTDAATNVTDTSATLNGVKGMNIPLAVFEYGTTTSYGQTVDAVSNHTFYDWVVIANLHGLTPATTYHFRLKSSTNLGLVGGDQQFTTKNPH
jgi:hypothetical protein